MMKLNLNKIKIMLSVFGDDRGKLYWIWIECV